MDEPTQTAGPAAKPIERRNVSKRIVQPALRYLDETAGHDVTDQVLEDIGLDRVFFDDVDGFMPLETTERLFEAAVRRTGDAEFPYHLGRATARYMNRMQGAIIGLLLSPSFIYQNMGRIEREVVRTTVVDVKRLAPNRFRLTVSFSDGYREPASACRNRHGTYESIPLMFGLPYATVKHTACAFRGDPHCVYEVTVPEHPFHWLRRLAIGLAAGAGITGAASLVLHNGTGALVCGGLLNLGLFSYMAFTSRRTRQSLKWARSTTAAAEAHTRALQQEYERTKFLYALTVELNRYLDESAICDRVIASLRQGFGYTTCQVWLAKGDAVRCVRADGLSERARGAVESAVYSLEKGLEQPDSFIGRVMGRRETMLINDPARAVSKFTAMTREFIALLDPSSAILVPLTDRDTVIGMLVATHGGGAKVTYIDRLLFEAAAPVVANALVRVRLYADLQERVAQREGEIRRRNDELLAAREMAIQSEKLSALGRMSAGIAHEINNPLNFLVNVMPELRNDTEALVNILRLGERALPQGQARQALEALTAQHHLDEHLQDTGYVFESIRRSLDKARRVVNSLRVFSRVSNAADPPSRERVLDLVTAALDVIPQKYKASVEVVIDIPWEHTVFVSRNEATQVFLSVLQNALEAVEYRGRVGIASLQTEECIAVSIRDNGPGPAPEALDRALEPFFTTKRREQHTGLGLTVAAEIMRKYGGSISLAAAAGGGAVCEVRFGRQAGGG